MFIPLYDDVEKRRPPIVAGLLIGLNLIVFVYQFRLSLEDPTWQTYIGFIKTWGLKPTDIAAGKYLTMYTCMFLHGDFMHFLGNMVVLWAFAWTLEELLGPVRFAVIYLACGLAAGGAWSAFNWGSEIPCVGASGAIAGVIGAYTLKFGVSTRVRCMMWFFGRPIFFYMSTMWFAGIWVATQLLGLMSASSNGGGVAWWAHLGGFFAGLLLLPLLNENTRELESDRDGSLSIQDVEIEEEITEPQPPPEPVAVHCEGCTHVLEETHQIAPKLFRCPGCGQLNLDPMALPPKVAPAR